MSSKESYLLRPVTDIPEEAQRLDDIHIGLTGYYGNKLSPAPLDEMQPTSFLEIGSGSGAWAIQAAIQFPQAKVVAVDINPLPPRAMPSNLEFKQLDITQSLPFDEESFDVIHSRLVLMHVRGGLDVLRKLVGLLKPGGWLLLEEPDMDSHRDGGKAVDPVMSALSATFVKILRARGTNPAIGLDLLPVLSATSAFSEVNVKKLTIPISEHSKDTRLNNLGRAWRTTMLRLGRDLPQRFHSQGITPEVGEKYTEAVGDLSRRLTTDMYIVWAYKFNGR